MRQAFSSKTGLIVALIAIVTLAVIGAANLYEKHVSAQRAAPIAALEQLRRAIVVHTDVQRFISAIRAAPAGAPLSAAEETEIARTLDVLRGHASAVGDLDVDGAGALRAALGALLEGGDAAQAADYESLVPLKTQISALSEMLSSAFLNVTRAQRTVELDYVEAQKRAFEGLILVSAVILGLLVLFALAALALFRKEMREHRRMIAAESRARFLAYYDALTKLPNRARFYEAVGEAMAKGEQPTIAIIDLDDFKLVNDVHGHDVGDLLLRTIAERLEAAAKAHGGMVARLGGDEFAAMLPGGLDQDAVRAFCVEAIEATRRPIVTRGVEIAPNASIGAAIAADLSNDRPITMSRLMKAADKALYASKGAGKGRFHLFDGALEREMANEIALERALDAALSADELFLEFQPQIDVRTGRVVGFEALSRWRRDGVLVPPEQFVAFAEKTGQVRDIDRMALTKAMATMAALRAEGLDPPHMSVNLSPLNFRDNEIVDFVRAQLDAHGLPANRITLEITETMLLNDWDRVQVVIDALHELGTRVALDDFGTGYSSLGYLRRLRLNELKIDRSLVADIEHSAQSRALLAAIVELAEALNLSLVFEGVETDEQAAHLSAFGCVIVQGFLYSAPGDADDARRWLIDPPTRAGRPARAAAPRRAQL